MPLDSVVAVDAVGGSTIVDVIITNPPIIVDIISGVGPQGPATRPGGTSGQIQYNNNSAFGGFTMSGDATVNTSTGALALSTSGVTAGTYQGLTVDAKGRVTAASNQSYLTGNQPITLSGDTTGTGSTSIATTTVQIQGRPVATTAPNDGQALLWSASNTRWQPGNVVTSGGVTMADTPPASPTQGQGWWNSNNAAGGGQLYLWFNDGTSSQWVPSANLTGFVTSLTAGTGITLSPNPIAGGGGTIALTTPVAVANGGTGAATLTANSVLVGNGTSAVTASPNLTLDASNNVVAANSIRTGNFAVLSPVFGTPTVQTNQLTGGPGTNVIISSNVYWSGNWTYTSAGTAGAHVVNATGIQNWLSFPSGTAGATATPTTTMTLDASGNLTASGYFTSLGGATVGNGAAAGNIPINVYTGSVQPAAAQFRWNGSATAGGGTQVGSISCTASTTAYNTASDLRLKSDMEPIPAAVCSDIIDKLEPVKFHWQSIEEGELPDGYGFSAQDANEVFPQAVTVGEGEMGDEGFRPWMMDYSKLVPVMLAEIKSLRARLASLETRGD